MRQNSRVKLNLAKNKEITTTLKPQTRPLRNTNETYDDADVKIINLSKLKYAKDQLRKLRISPGGCLKYREIVRFLVQRPRSSPPDESVNCKHIVRHKRFLRI